jgi:2-amino-4-hydroxy-6-hydroxymethyldihydropteridine diphosphokinase
MGVRVFVGLGSNLNDPLKQLQAAVAAITHLPKTQMQSVSGVYLTHPMGPQDQPDYLNAVVELQTTLEAKNLLKSLQEIESQQGRVRDGSRWHERSIDLDILLYGEECISTVSLIVPHPGMHERAFVLYPLQELDEDLSIPGRGDIRALIHQPLDGTVLQRLDVKLWP